MKTLSKAKCLAAALCIFVVAMDVGRAQDADATKQIEKTLQDYLTAMSARDVDGLRTVLDKQFTAIEAADTSAKVHSVDTSNGKGLLPPKGNDDWDKDKLKLTSVKVEVSATHSSVAMASFVLTFPLSDKSVANFETALKEFPAEFDEARKKAAMKIIADRAIHNSMFAMLARQDGKWKIVCMSIPK